jgi:hypothetical protein
MANDFLLNGIAGLGGGLGAMPIALPYSLGGAVPGILGAALPEDTRNQVLGVIAGGAGAALPMGMINRDGQMMMGQQQPMTTPQNNAMDQMAAYRMMAQGLQGMAPKQQMQQPQLQVMRDQNQFRFAGTPQQQMAQALRRR